MSSVSTQTRFPIPSLMSAGADAVREAGYGERSAERSNFRNGNHHRDVDALDLAIPKLRSGSYCPNDQPIRSNLDISDEIR